MHLTETKTCKYQNCGYETTFTENLDRHVKSKHLLVKQHVCAGCEKMFSRKDHLKQHQVGSRCKRHEITVPSEDDEKNKLTKENAKLKEENLNLQTKIETLMKQLEGNDNVEELVILNK